MKTFILIGVFVIACVSSSSALRCFECIFPGSPNCQTVKDIKAQQCTEPSSIEAATGIKPVCMKNVIDIQGVKQITRACSKQGGSINACSLLGNNVEHCSTCDQDECNGSSIPIIHIISTIIPIFLAFFFKCF